MKRIVLSVLLLGAGAGSFAQVPPLLSYQGRLTASGTNFNGPGWFKFALGQHGANLARPALATAALNSNGGVASVTVQDGGAGYTAAPAVTIVTMPGPLAGGATAGATVSHGAVTGIAVLTPGSNYFLGAFVNVAPPPADYVLNTLWNDNGSITDPEPSLPVALPVTDGYFTVTLGDPMQTVWLDPWLFTNGPLWLRIWFSADGATYQRLSPDQPLTAAPYSFMAAQALNVVGVLPGGGLAGTYGATVQLTNAANRLAGDGAGLTGLNASELRLGTVPDSELSSNVARLDASQTFTGANVFKNANFADGSGAQGAGGNPHVGGYTANGDPKLIHFGDRQPNGLGYVYLGENGLDDTLEFRASRFFFNLGNVGIGTSNPAAALEVGGAVKAGSFAGNASGLTNLSAASLASGTTVGTVTFNPPSGPPFAVGNPGLVTNLNADWLDGLGAGAFWQLGGNSGTAASNYLGTADHQPLDLRANHSRGLRLQYASHPAGAPLYFYESMNLLP